MPTTATLETRVAGLADNSQIISGVAIGEGDITRGLSGDRKVWTADALRAAASTLEGVPVTAMHSSTEVGRVTAAGYEPGVGVLYEAEIDDAQLAERAVSAGMEVSVEARHADGGSVETEQGTAMAATNVHFTALALEPEGAAPSASVTPGEAAALAPADIRAALESNLAEVNGTEIDLTAPERVKNAVRAGMEAKAEYDTLSDCGTGVGEAIGQAILDDALTPEIILSGGDIADNGGPVTYLSSHADDAPDSAPTEWDEETWTDGCGPVQDALWGHYLEWFEGKQAELEQAMETEANAYGGDKEASLEPVPDEYIFDNPGEAVEKAQEMGLEGAADDIIHTHGEGDDTRFMPAPNHEALMDMLEEMDELAASAEFKPGDLVRWSTSASPGTGRVAEVVTEPGATVSADGADVTREATEEEAAYKLDNYVGPEAGYDEGAVVKSASEILGAWEDAPEEAQMAGAATVGPTATDDPTGARPSGTAGAADPDATPDATDATDDSSTSNPTDTTLRDIMTDDDIEALRETLEEVRAELAGDDPDDEQPDAEAAAVDAARDAHAAALAEHVPRDAEALKDDLSLPQMREWLADLSDGDGKETSDAELAPTVQSGTDGESNTATLSDSEREREEELKATLSAVEGKTGPLAESTRRVNAEELAEITGDDPETIVEKYN